MNTQILALDIAGTPFGWIIPQEAVHYYATGKVAWDLGEREIVFRGGYARSGAQSRIAVKPIIAVAGSEIMARKLRVELPLGDQNDLLFRRDRHTCAYCGEKFRAPKTVARPYPGACARRRDTWMNCVTSCRACNQKKGHKLVHDFRPLVYRPTCHAATSISC